MPYVRPFLQLVVLLILLNGCSKQESNPLEGTWTMESGTYTNLKENQKIETDQIGRFSIKIMAPNHFAVVEMFKSKPDSLFFAAVGTYQLTKNKYIEKYEASNVGYQVGTSREFDYSLQGDRWTITQFKEDIELREVWVRVR
ncbi:MAG: hypothetical protein ACE5HI_01530 [bacterium]